MLSFEKGQHHLLDLMILSYSLSYALINRIGAQLGTWLVIRLATRLPLDECLQLDECSKANIFYMTSSNASTTDIHKGPSGQERPFRPAYARHGKAISLANSQ